MESLECFVEVLLPLAVEGTYAYAVPSGMAHQVQVGVRVLVPLGKRKLRTGLVVSIHAERPKVELVREVIQVLDTSPVVLPEQLALWQWMAEYYVCSLGEIFRAAVPPFLRSDSEAYVSPVSSDASGCPKLTPLQEAIHASVQRTGDVPLVELLREFPQRGALTALHRLADASLVRIDERIRCDYASKQVPFVRLAAQMEGLSIEQMLGPSKRVPAQRRLLEVLLELLGQEGADPTFEAVLRHDLLACEGVSSGALGALLKKGILVQEQREVSRIVPSVSRLEPLKPLSDVQAIAYSKLLRSMEEKPVTLLRGVTGSGKTELYMHAIETMLQQGKRSLFLLPEIALTEQMIGRLRAVFGARVGTYHSRMSNAERLELYMALLRDEPLPGGEHIDVLLCARSGIFLPLRCLGLVIVDEEHETSFKQESPAPRYQARDTALILARLYGAQVILGSATPSLESYTLATSGRYGLVELAERYGPSTLPTVRIVDLRAAKAKGELYGHFSKELLDGLVAAVDAGGQAILFQNRRGFAPFLTCESCGWVAGCSACDVSYTYHKDQGKLRCHYCGATAALPSVCHICGSARMVGQGLGTERVVEELSKLLPDLRIARLDLDSTQGKHAFQKLFDRFSQGEFDVLVGTQMVTKGLDFSRVHLVGIMDADSMLAQPDFRATERAYHLMAQVGGRAGRREVPGTVLIQTRQPEKPIFGWICQHEFLEFFRTVRKERESVGYPPYWRIIAVTGSHSSLALAQSAMECYARELRQFKGLRILGPQVPFIARVAHLHRVQLLVKAPREMDYRSVRQMLRHATQQVAQVKDFGGVRMVVDVDPL